MATTTRPLVFTGTAADDFVIGTALGDSLRGNDGNDQLFGGDGGDFIYGGNGADIINGDNGADNLTGDAGDDIVSGGAGDDSLNGNDGDDQLFGGDGRDRLTGGNGRDTLTGDSGDDTLDGGDGDDVFSDGDGRDSVRLGRGADTYIAGRGSDNISDQSDRTGAIDVADYSQINTAVSFDIVQSIRAATVNESGIVDNDSLSGVEVIIGTALDDTFTFRDSGINSIVQPGTRFGFEVSGGEGADTFVSNNRSAFTGDAAAPIVTDFSLGEDRLGFDAASLHIGELVPVLDENGDPVIEIIDLGDGTVIEVPLEEFVTADLSFQNVARDGEGVDAGLSNVDAGRNLYVLQGSFASADAAADALAVALAGGDIDEGEGVGVYFDAAEQRLRSFVTDDLDNIDADARVLLNLESNLSAQESISLLPTLSASDFLFV